MSVIFRSVQILSPPLTILFLLQVWSLMPLENSEINKSRSRKTWRYNINWFSIGTIQVGFYRMHHVAKTLVPDFVTDKMLHMWHRKWLLWYHTTWLWDAHFRWTQPGQLHVSSLPLCWSLCVYMCEYIGDDIKVLNPYRFFLMYLINKDETEHTGQVSLICFLTV